tara:strand:+ start:5528 stop:6223 length:696 start_codon:yes stop_codon:yes gene_type:complete
MAFDGLFLDEDGLPVERQPVPIYLAALIARMTPDEYLKLCAVEAREFRLGINVYQYIENTEPKKVQPKMLLNYVTNAINPIESKNNSISLSNVFVWSDELLWQISKLIDEQYETREDAVRDGVTIDWDPAQLEFSATIAQSTDFYNLLSSALKKKYLVYKRTMKARSKYKKWCEKYMEIFPHFTHEDIQSKKAKGYLKVAKIIEKDPVLNPEGQGHHHIREMIRKNILHYL